MNFQDLLLKMRELDESMNPKGVEQDPTAGAGAGDESVVTSAPPVAPTKDDQPGAGAGDESVKECGNDMPGDIVHPPKQADNVTMNVSINGSGSGGIKDLMDILRNIEQRGPVEPSHGDGEHDALFGDSYENSAKGGSEEELLGVDAVLPTGDDLASKGGEAEKVNGGGNPMQESLVARLQAMYNTIKESPETSMAMTGDATAPYKSAIDYNELLKAYQAYKQLNDMASKTGNKELEAKLYDAARKRNAASQSSDKQVPGKDNDHQARPSEVQFAKDIQAIYKEVFKKDLPIRYNFEEAYNPNSASAEHRRKLDQHDHDRLKAAAEKDGATDADKARYKRYQDKKAAVKAAYDAEMERE